MRIRLAFIKLVLLPWEIIKPYIDYVNYSLVQEMAHYSDKIFKTLSNILGTRRVKKIKHNSRKSL